MGGVIKFILLSLFPTNLNTTLHLIVESYIYKINWRDFGYDSSMLATEKCAFDYRLNAAFNIQLSSIKRLIRNIHGRNIRKSGYKQRSDQLP